MDMGTGTATALALATTATMGRKRKTGRSLILFRRWRRPHEWGGGAMIRPCLRRRRVRRRQRPNKEGGGAPIRACRRRRRVRRRQRPHEEEGGAMINKENRLILFRCRQRPNRNSMKTVIQTAMVERISDALHVPQLSPPLPPPFARGGKSAASGLFPPLRRGDTGGFFECLCVAPGSPSRRLKIALARFARALHTAIKKGCGAHTFSPREKVPRRAG